MSTPAEKPTQVTVSTTVTINGTTKTFTAAAETDTSGEKVAQGLVYAVDQEATSWINDLREARRTR